MMNKSWFSKYALVWMIGSLMLLFTVLLIWNIENYNGQKKELYKLIDYNAQLAAGEVRDSLLKITLNGTINTTIKTTNENQYVSIILSDKRKETSNDSLIFDMVSKFEKSKSSMDSISKLNESEGAFTSGKDRFENKTVTVLHRRLKENNIPFTYTYSSIDSLLIDSDNVNNEQWQKITSQKSL